MDAQVQPTAAERADCAVTFTGNWREYLPIAATNVLLIIVTLGIYRFWAAARERRYLWSRTHFIDDPLEWTGTGKEMFVGFLVALAVLLPFFLFIQFLFPALLARGEVGAAGAIIILFYLGLLYLGGFARFRMLRYRLSRTWWHGIRGGSDDPGWRFGGEYLVRNLVSAVTVFILFPWAAAHLWNARWSQMSFGPLRFAATLSTDGLKARWAIVYLAPIVLVVALLAMGGAAIARGAEPNASLVVVLIGLGLLLYIAVPLATLHWFAKFYRRAAAETSLGELRFRFDATTLQWLGLFLGNLLLALVTFGLGIAYWGYRNWSFMVRHLSVHGEIDLAALTESTTRTPRGAEGFADAFDIGAL